MDTVVNCTCHSILKIRVQSFKKFVAGPKYNKMWVWNMVWCNTSLPGTLLPVPRLNLEKIHHKYFTTLKNILKTMQKYLFFHCQGVIFSQHGFNWFLIPLSPLSKKHGKSNNWPPPPPKKVYNNSLKTQKLGMRIYKK